MLNRWIVLTLVLAMNFVGLADAGPRAEVDAAITKLHDSEPGFSWNTIVKDRVGEEQFERDNVGGRCRKDGYGSVEVRLREKRLYLISYFNPQGDYAISQNGEWKSAKEMSPEAAKPGADRELQLSMTAPDLALSIDQIRATLAGASDVKLDGEAYEATLTKEQIDRLLEKRVPESWQSSAPPPVIHAVDADTGTVRYMLKDGALARMQLHLIGTVRLDPDHTIKIDRTVRTDFSQIEAGKLFLPERVMAVWGR